MLGVMQEKESETNDACALVHGYSGGDIVVEDALTAYEIFGVIAHEISKPLLLHNLMHEKSGSF
ncbi:hypothetical protein [Sporosarcina saromensis]|uniref:hypothetical protein n=1 Tax=Sporosarcina saromensis TaxID=359365 RepID=UPI00295EB8D5|nr:hypothetical protein [Sporosarcina saromensis]